VQSQGGITITDLIKFSLKISISDGIRMTLPCLGSLLSISRVEENIKKGNVIARNESHSA
jgi:hypothetical protein